MVFPGNLKQRPWLTYSVMAVCIAIFLCLNLFATNWQQYNRFGLYSINDLRDGYYWAIITNNFAHLEWWHLLFNMYWLGVFGVQIETVAGRKAFLLLVVATALAASAFQVLLADEIGLGFSGVGYGMFGFLWIQARYGEPGKFTMEKGQINLFVAWFFICILLTKYEVLNVANAAHFGGFVAGAAFAFVQVKRSKPLGAVSAFLLIAVSVPCFWAPWSISTMEQNALALHQRGQYNAAKQLYAKILAREPQNDFAITNKNNIEIYELSEAATYAMLKAEYKRMDSLLNQILLIDTVNEWALQQKRLLPQLQNVQYQIIPDE